MINNNTSECWTQQLFMSSVVIEIMWKYSTHNAKMITMLILLCRSLGHHLHLYFSMSHKALSLANRQYCVVNQKAATLRRQIINSDSIRDHNFSWHPLCFCPQPLVFTFWYFVLNCFFLPHYPIVLLPELTFPAKRFWPLEHHQLPFQEIYPHVFNHFVPFCIPIFLVILLFKGCFQFFQFLLECGQMLIHFRLNII